MAQYKENTNLRYMDWNPYLHSVNDDLNVINSLIPECYDLGQGNVKRLAINLQGLYYSRHPFINQPKVIEKINEVITKFHDNTFMKDYNEKTPRAMEYELKCLNILLDKCYSKIVAKLSQNKLIPEVEITKEEEIDELYKGMAI